MTEIKDHTRGLKGHVNELEDIGAITAEEASELQDRIRKLEKDLEAAYDDVV